MAYVCIYMTPDLCYINEVDVAKYCDWSSEKQWPCHPRQGYYGRGPLQLSWNYNYGPAGRSLGFDGLGDPDRLAQDPVLSFKSALWYWMENMHQLMPQGFGATIRAINGFDECHGGKNTAEMKDRVRFYLEYCHHFRVHPGLDLSC
jgi:chitinase